VTLAFSLTLALSALLLFLVQPMAGRLVLPLLGGSPAVWTTAMVFFQAMLLAGYAWAHLLASRLSLVRQGMVHLAVLAAGLLVLPIALPAGAAPPADAFPIPWLLALLTATVGLPFFALAANAPLLQRWFSLSGHPDAGRPYFLYAASNLGSVLALIGYPALLEPWATLGQQGWVWSAGYALLIAAVAGCLLAARRGAGSAMAAEAPAPPVRWPDRLMWLVLAAVPSSLMLGVTLHISTDVAAAPFLWVVPLTLYLLSFVLTFARRPPLPHGLMLWLQAAALIALLVFFFTPYKSLWYGVGLHLAGFFLTAMVCHGELARRQPPAGRLTEFYLWLSLGGVLGGAVNAIAAPLLLNSVAEYPAVLLLAALLRPQPAAPAPAARRWDVVLPLVLAAVLLPLMWQAASDPAFDPREGGTAAKAGIVVLAALLAILLLFSRRPLRFALGLATVLAGNWLYARSDDRLVASERSFFGVHRVFEDARQTRRVLVHGTTWHGVEALTPELRGQPLSYYHSAGPVGAMFAAVRRRAPAPKVGVVGLGAGALLPHRRTGEDWHFYEIDPVVERIARNPALFGYFERHGAGVPVRLGDARLVLDRLPGEGYDLLFLDAFSSDAVPVHLLTLEAFDIYLRHLAPGGIVAVHISNWYVDLEPSLAAAVGRLGLAASLRHFSPREEGVDPALVDAKLAMASTWVAVARDPAALAPLWSDGRWRPLRPEPGTRPWTDDYANLLGAVRWGGVERE